MATASRNLHRLAVDVGTVPRSAMIAAARAVKTVAGDEARRAGYATVRVWRKRSASYRTVKLRARDRISVQGDTVRCRVQGVPVGPWVWANTGTAAHLIGAGAGRGSTARATRRRSKALAFGPDQVRRPPVAHPGSKGRHAWRRTADRAGDVVPRIFRDELHRAVT